MSKRDLWTLFFLYVLSAELVFTGASLLFNSLLVFYIGQLITILGAIFVTALTVGTQNKEK
jgi:hypothetical protein